MEVQLSWEHQHPERAIWSAHAARALRPHLTDLSVARDIRTFAPEYQAATDDEKTAIWAEIISAVAWFESTWNPCERYAEPGMGIDTVTGEPVYSEGLLQLSYQDVKNYPHLEIPFDWDRDKLLARTDCSKSILDPLKNITAGVSILADQVKRERAIVLKHPYWSTLGDPSEWHESRIEEIAAMVRKLPFSV